MYQPSFIRTVTAGTGIPPVHAPLLTLVGCPISGVPPVGNWVLKPAPCPEGYWLFSGSSISAGGSAVNKLGGDDRKIWQSTPRSKNYFCHLSLSYSSPKNRVFTWKIGKFRLTEKLRFQTFLFWLPIFYFTQGKFLCYLHKNYKVLVVLGFSREKLSALAD
jgi:hypothetical protein